MKLTVSDITDHSDMIDITANEVYEMVDQRDMIENRTRRERNVACNTMNAHDTQPSVTVTGKRGRFYGSRGEYTISTYLLLTYSTSTPCKEACQFHTTHAQNYARATAP